MNTYIERAIPTTGAPPTRKHVLALLRGVQDPHSGLDIVTLGWVGHVTIVHSAVIVALHPPGRSCATHCAIDTAIARTLQSHLGADRLRLRVRWGVPGTLVTSKGTRPLADADTGKRRSTPMYREGCGSEENGTYTAHCGAKRTSSHRIAP
jgi:metal-sulfur cluster biosynthetic enzyme